mmetsp:Transcript_3934/g.8442  ORF Transcript_3934/g.8442 Transcript_3934/m.8442 type:complete len:88 (+) Transcript_3934:113-376(+)
MADEDIAEQRLSPEKEEEAEAPQKEKTCTQLELTQMARPEVSTHTLPPTKTSVQSNHPAGLETRATPALNCLLVWKPLLPPCEPYAM